MNTQKKIIYSQWAIIAILIAVIIYLLLQQSKQAAIIWDLQHHVEADSITISEKLAQLEELNLALNRAKIEIEEFGRNSDSLQMRIDELNQYILKVKAGQVKKVAELNARIEEFKKLLKLKDAEIAMLRAKADSLTLSLYSMSKEKLKMKDTITTLKITQDELQQKLALASILKAEDITVTAINKKGKEIEKGRAKDVAKLKLSFTFADNKVARQDYKDIYMQLIDPMGMVVEDKNIKGGKMRIFDSTELAYSQKQTIKFDNTRQTVTFLHEKAGGYAPGTYKVDFYAEGYLIGETGFIIHR
ncbi:MAG: hypothetical protein NZ529_02625 [Cytophagaceae bacterium]|nr:hypothetical protein [Cytophagaceae bacterium]MDW8455665.1 hypothetical protein [Cytophagaceae bacterium]